jgi:hypothetical protein
MKPIHYIAAAALVVVLAAGVWYFAFKKSPTVVTTPPQTATSTAPVMSTFASSTLGFSVQYPPSYTVNDSYAYDQFGPKKLIHGVSFTIPATMATGTNLSSDTRVSVEQLPHAKKCTADIFIPANVKASTIVDNGVSYSFASTTGAAAGNRYDETVYALPNSSPCTAVRYYIHYGVLQNYPAGSVQQFDQAALLKQFDTIRQSLVIGQ